MFGFPSGIGALIVRKESAGVLKKTYFGGGTVFASLSDLAFHKLRDEVHARHEDGTIPFLSILSLREGFNMLNKLGIENIQK